MSGVSIYWGHTVLPSSNHDHSLTFGAGGKDPETGEVVEGWGYYETIAGGSGAGEGWNGTSGVQ